MQQLNLMTHNEIMLDKAITYAKQLTKQSGIKYVVRENCGEYYVVPLLGYVGYAALGILIRESL